MKSLKDTVLDHVKGESGMTNPMMQGYLQSKLWFTTSKERKVLYAIVDAKRLLSTDEDETSAADCILTAINEYVA